MLNIVLKMSITPVIADTLRMQQVVGSVAGLHAACCRCYDGLWFDPEGVHSSGYCTRAVMLVGMNV